jgi:hypothetical protein
MKDKWLALGLWALHGRGNDIARLIVIKTYLHLQRVFVGQMYNVCGPG